MGDGHAIQLVLQRVRQILIGRMHVGELRVAQGPAVAHRDAYAVKHVAERNGAAVGHVCVPILARIAQAHRLAVLHDVRQDHYLWQAGFEVHVRDIQFQRPEVPRERLQAMRVKRLLWKADHAVRTQRRLDGAVVLHRQGLGQVDIQNADTQGTSACNDLHDVSCL
ncbi:hypothetical protein D3C85_1433400 [compost metagenome]